MLNLQSYGKTLDAAEAIQNPKSKIENPLCHRLFHHAQALADGFIHLQLDELA
jgi:hypothetical protein